MAIKDYWIYQKRDVPTPWALYIVVEYDKRKPGEEVIDWTLYHEDIPNATHSKSYLGYSGASVSTLAHDISSDMEEHVIVTEQDRTQIASSLHAILLR